MPCVALRDGIHFDLDQRIVADGRSGDGDIHVVTHAHADHLPRAVDGTVLCAPVTADLVAERGGARAETVEQHDTVELLPAGHIVGSRAARFTHDGTTYLYTGDVCTRDRCYLDGFEPVDADVLVVETTYGVPAYTFPDHDELVGQIMDWIADNADRPLILHGYSLGRAQKLQHIVRNACDRPLYVHDAVAAMNDVIAEHTDLTFDATSYSDAAALEDDAVLVTPPKAANNAVVDRLVEQRGAVTAMFSGWAASGNYADRRGVDAAFPLSDHCDFDELVALVQAVDPDRVYTHHGFDEAFAAYLRDEYGYDAVPLQRDQATLHDF